MTWGFLQKTKPVPEQFWNSDDKVLMNCVYRKWDRQIIDVEAVSVTSREKAAAWRWKSDKPGRAAPGFESISRLVLLFVSFVCLVRKVKTDHGNEPAISPQGLARKFPDKWAITLYALMLTMLLDWISYVRLSDQQFQNTAENLLREIQMLELRKSTWQDVSRIQKRYARYITTESPCSPAHCDFRMTLDHSWVYLKYSRYESHLGEFLWRATKLPAVDAPR
jgi:hypothetical protein